MGVALHCDEIDAVPVSKGEGDLAIFQEAPFKIWFRKGVDDEETGKRSKNQRGDEKFLLPMSPELDGQKSEKPKERNSIIEAFILAVGGIHVTKICRKKGGKYQVNAETAHPYLGVGERFVA